MDGRCVWFEARYGGLCIVVGRYGLKGGRECCGLWQVCMVLREVERAVYCGR